jgi:hypothetical protein
VLPDRHERRFGVAVVDVPSGVTAAVEEQDRRVGAEAGDSLADDRARGHRDLNDAAPTCAADGRYVNALIERPVSGRNHA